MNIRRGLSRIYMVFSGLVLAVVCVAAVASFPKKIDIANKYEYKIKDVISDQLHTPTYQINWGGLYSETFVTAACSDMIEWKDATGLCKKYEDELKSFWWIIAKYIAEWTGWLLLAAISLTAIKRTAAWVADGFASK